MAREFHIKTEEGKSLEETADWIALSASAVLHELFSALEWWLAMTLIAQRINRTVADDDATPAE
jgi:hypothetical protein